jgi:hypothetical protein
MDAQQAAEVCDELVPELRGVPERAVVLAIVWGTGTIADSLSTGLAQIARAIAGDQRPLRR